MSWKQDPSEIGFCCLFLLLGVGVPIGIVVLICLTVYQCVRMAVM